MGANLTVIRAVHCSLQGLGHSPHPPQPNLQETGGSARTQAPHSHLDAVCSCGGWPACWPRYAGERRTGKRVAAGTVCWCSQMVTTIGGQGSWSVLPVPGPRESPGDGGTHQQGSCQGQELSRWERVHLCPSAPGQGSLLGWGWGCLSLIALLEKSHVLMNVAVGMEATLRTPIAAQCSPGGYRDLQREHSSQMWPLPGNVLPPHAGSREGWATHAPHRVPGHWPHPTQEGTRGRDSQWADPDSS